MPHFKTEQFNVKNDAGSAIELKASISITADGEFYANLPEYLADAFSGQASPTRRAPEKVRVAARTFEELKKIIKAGLERHLEPEITETPVIRYNIESHCSFATDANGTIFPNASYPGARWAAQGQEDLFGNHHATDPSDGGYSLTIGAKAMMKRVIRHGDNQRVEYSYYYKGESHLGTDNPAQILNSWTAIHLGDDAKEIPYSDNAALFFHQLLLSMATLNRTIQLATFEQESLLELIESQKGLALLGGPATSPDGEFRIQSSKVGK